VAVLPLPAVLLPRAEYPAAVLSLPVLFSKRAPDPVAVLLLPVVLKMRAKVPEAVLLLPEVSLARLSSPIAVLEPPVRMPDKAPTPNPVLMVPVAPMPLLTPKKVLEVPSEHTSLETATAVTGFESIISSCNGYREQWRWHGTFQWVSCTIHFPSPEPNSRQN